MKLNSQSIWCLRIKLKKKSIKMKGKKKQTKLILVNLLNLRSSHETEITLLKENSNKLFTPLFNQPDVEGWNWMKMKGHKKQHSQPGLTH